MNCEKANNVDNLQFQVIKFPLANTVEILENHDSWRLKIYFWSLEELVSSKCGLYLRGVRVLVKKLIWFTDHILTTYQPHTDHIPTTFTDHIPTTFTDHIPTTYRPPLPTTYRPPLPTTYRPHINHIPTTYQPPLPTTFTNHIPTKSTFHYYLVWVRNTMNACPRLQKVRACNSTFSQVSPQWWGLSGEWL